MALLVYGTVGSHQLRIYLHKFWTLDPLPLGQIIFISMQFLGKFEQK